MVLIKYIFSKKKKNKNKKKKKKKELKPSINGDHSLRLAILLIQRPTNYWVTCLNLLKIHKLTTVMNEDLYQDNVHLHFSLPSNWSFAPSSTYNFLSLMKYI